MPLEALPTTLAGVRRVGGRVAVVCTSAKDGARKGRKKVGRDAAILVCALTAEQSFSLAIGRSYNRKHWS